MSIPKPASLQAVLGSMADYDPAALSVRQAQQIIQQMLQPLACTEKLTVRQALGRVLAEHQICPINVPPYDNSAMDGYAFHSAELARAAELSLNVIGVAYAGVAYSGPPVRPGECIRIMTGALMPAGCDSVIPQELTTQTAGQNAVQFSAAKIRAGDNVRRAGEDLAVGQQALKRGKILRPADLGLLASLGIAEVAVQRRLRVAFFSTGDELRSLGEPLDEGCVYDSNRYTLHAMLNRLGCDIIDMGVIRDRPEAIEAAFRQASANADAVITSGGVSVGDADFTRQIMDQLGEVAFWNIGMRPGRPMAFGRIGDAQHQAYLFGLPGNPVAVMVSFYFFVRTALLQLMGAEAAAPLLIAAVSQNPIRKRRGRTEYQRGIASTDDHGRLSVQTTGAQGSGILRSMSEANCMIVLDDQQESVQAGDTVRIILFDGLI